MEALDRHWLFDPTSGYLVEFNSGESTCERTGYRHTLDILKDVCCVSRTNSQAYFRRYGLKPFVKKIELKDQSMGKDSHKAITDERCPECNKKGLLFFTLQLRSADEGQTVFYECPACGHKFSQNN